MSLKNSIPSLQIHCQLQVQKFLKFLSFCFFTSLPYRPKWISRGSFISFFSRQTQFPLKKFFRGNLNEAISLAEIASFRFPWNTFLKRKLTYRCLIITSKLIIKLTDIPICFGFCKVVNNIWSVWKYVAIFPLMLRVSLSVLKFSNFLQEWYFSGSHYPPKFKLLNLTHHSVLANEESLHF